MTRRIVDILISLAALAAGALPGLLIAIAIRRESPGGAIFRQRRVGLNGKCFDMLKFRTMRSDADPYGDSPNSGQDSRLTRVGRFLRETSLDELPQLVNVLAGQMTLIGPRPLYERQAALWTARQRRRLEVKPGLTGFAQVYGRGSLTHERKIDLDVYYVDNQGFGMDLRIIFRTIADLFLTGRSEIYERQCRRAQEPQAHRKA